MAVVFSLIGSVQVYLYQESLWFLLGMASVVAGFGMAIPNIFSTALVNYKHQVGTAGASELRLPTGKSVYSADKRNVSSWLELVDVARCDALLQCGNRQAFAEDLAHYQKRYRDSKAEWNLGVFILDVNGLKAINDQYGHDLGDELIRTSSSHISALLSENGSLYRIGGDEFALLTKGMTRKECTLLAEQLHVSQESLKFFDKEGKAYDANYSIGWSCSDNADLFKMFTIADESMYQDKREYYLHL
ncbi:GGDEF domain-containing protein [Aliivibrio finisterrensis]|nr:diguanylate cyclase [Aliivibrio finisterrensis]